MTIGMYETPIWGKKGWLNELKTDAAYDVDDLLPAMRNGLSVDGKLYAAPFYGELDADVPPGPGRQGRRQVRRAPDLGRDRDLAAKIHDPKARRLRHLPARQAGLGRQHGLPVTTMVNSFGGQWFDMSWKPQLESKPWKDAITFYVDLLKNYGPPARRPTASTRSWRSTNEGKVRHVDRRDHRRLVHQADPKQSKVADRWPSPRRPYAPRQKGANWLWAWALAIPAGTKNADAAQKFITWATVEGLHPVGGQDQGLGPRAHRHAQVDLRRPGVPEGRPFRRRREDGHRQRQPERQHAAQEPVRVGVQFAAIPEFQAIGIAASR